MDKPQTFKELVDLYLESPQYHVLSEGSRIVYTGQLKLLLKTGAHCKLYYTQDTVACQKLAFQWFNRLRALNGGTASNYTRNELRRMLVNIYQWGVTNLGLAPYSTPTLWMPKLIHEVREFEPFDQDDMKKVIDAMAVKGYYRLKQRERWTAWITRFLFETGMRPAEMFNLTNADVVYEEDDRKGKSRDRFLQIIGAKGRERGKVSRYVYVTPVVQECLDWMAEYRKTRKEIDGDWVFISHIGTKVKANALSPQFRSLMRKLDMDNKQLYDLRRGCATEIINNPEYGLNVAQKQLGHKSITTTMIYEKLNKKRAAKLYRGHAA